MPSGKFGSADLAANTTTPLYTTPAGKVHTVTLHFCNRTAADIPIRAVIHTGAQTDADWIYYDAIVKANDVRGLEKVVVGAGETLSVSAAAAGISARVAGFEEVA